MTRYQIKVKRMMVETYEVEAWSAKQAKAEHESLPKLTPVDTTENTVKRVIVSVVKS